MAEGGNVPELGGYDYEFTSRVPEDWECFVCKLTLKDPVQIVGCGHRLCKICMESLLRRPAPTCPMDRQPLSRRKIFPDAACHRNILDLTVKCSYSGCQWTGELRAVEKHQSECLYKVVKCPNPGCPAMRKMEMLEKRQQDELQLIKEQQAKVDKEALEKQMQIVREADMKAQAQLKKQLAIVVENEKQANKDLQEMRQLFEKSKNDAKAEREAANVKFKQMQAESTKAQTQLQEQFSATLRETQTNKRLGIVVNNEKQANKACQEMKQLFEKSRNDAKAEREAQRQLQWQLSDMSLRETQTNKRLGIAVENEKQANKACQEMKQLLEKSRNDAKAKREAASVTIKQMQAENANAQRQQSRAIKRYFCERNSNQHSLK